MIFHPEKLSALLTKARTNKGFSQTYMAQKLGISQKAYSYIESGNTKLDLIKILKIAHTTEMHPMAFIDKISEGIPSWECVEPKEKSLTKEVEKLEAFVAFLKSENAYLRKAMDKIFKIEADI